MTSDFIVRGSGHHQVLTVSIMGRSKELCAPIREKIIEKSRRGLSSIKIAQDLDLKPSTVRYNIMKFKKTGTVTNRERQGRPKKLTDKHKRLIVRKVKCEPRKTSTELALELEEESQVKVSPETIRRTLRASGLNGRVARKKPLLKPRHKKHRLKFAKEHQNKPPSFWKRVLWSDETKMNLFESDGKVYVWRHPNEAFKEENVVPTVKHGGGSVMLWGCMSAGGTGRLHFIEGIMDRFMYKGILSSQMLPSAKTLIGGKYIFQHDNDPKHTSKVVKEFLAQKKVKVLDWPAMSPDLNPIEQIWQLLKVKVKARNPSGIPALKTIIQEEWDAIAAPVCEKYVKSMSRRLQAVINAKGAHTKY